MEIINVQIPSEKEFNLVDYIPGYSGVIIAIRNGNPIGMIVFEDDEDYPFLMDCNRTDCNSQKNFDKIYYESIVDLIDKNKITELKLIEFK